jgi:hypothetical protein
MALSLERAPPPTSFASLLFDSCVYSRLLSHWVVCSVTWVSCLSHIAFLLHRRRYSPLFRINVNGAIPYRFPPHPTLMILYVTLLTPPRHPAQDVLYHVINPQLISIFFSFTLSSSSDILYLGILSHFFPSRPRISVLADPLTPHLVTRPLAVVCIVFDKFVYAK